MTRDQFATKCGELLSHVVYSTGNAPQRTWIVTFHYEKGIAHYDGRHWLYELD